jgi:hypothetical protein
MSLLKEKDQELKLATALSNILAFLVFQMAMFQLPRTYKAAGFGYVRLTILSKVLPFLVFRIILGCSKCISRDCKLALVSL